MTTKESPLHENYKKLALEKGVYDTLYSDRFDGLPSRVNEYGGSTKTAKKRLKIMAAFLMRRHSEESQYALLQDVCRYSRTGMEEGNILAYTANSFKQVNAATVNGDTDFGVLPVGQSAGLIHDSDGKGDNRADCHSSGRGNDKNPTMMMQ